MKKILFILLTIFLVCIIFATVKYQKESPIQAIKFSSWGSQSETAILKELISEYEKKNNIKIDFIHIPQNYFQKIQLLFASGLEPDIVFINNHNIQMYINAGLLEDLTKYVNVEDFFPEAIECFSKNGSIYAIPRDISTLVIYYNKELINKFKIDIVHAVESTDTLVEELSKVNDTQIYGINFEENPLFWSYYLASIGGGILTDDGENILITSPESINALQLYSDMINKYHIMPSKSQIGSKTTAQMFINGELVMYLGGRWMTPKFRETIDFDWDIIQFPSSNKNKLYADASGWALTKNSKNKKEAIDFINYLASEESLKALAETGLIIPANKKAAFETVKNDINKNPKHSSIFIDMLKNTKPTPINKNYAAINDIISEKMSYVFSGSITAKNAIDKKIEKKLERLLK